MTAAKSVSHVEVFLLPIKHMKNFFNLSYSYTIYIYIDRRRERESVRVVHVLTNNSCIKTVIYKMAFGQ